MMTEQFAAQSKETILTRFRCSVVVLLAFLVVVASQAHGPATQDVTYCQLAKDPSAFSGKRIRVRAVYRYGPKVQDLEPPDCCPNEMDLTWLKLEPWLRGDSLKQFAKFPKAEGIVLATFAGTFKSGGAYGVFGDKYELDVDEIDDLEGTAPSPLRQNDPPWVPQNCRYPRATPAAQR
jgi:hypothetical protein